MKKLKALLCLIITVCMCLFVCGCGYEYAELDLRAEYSRELAGTTLNVYNWGEYISDGGEGSIDVNKEFERLTGIKVNYTTFESNETMYSQLKNGGIPFDIIIPSDYMIERLKNEDMLSKIDLNKISNFDLIDPQYTGLFYDENNEYSVAYNVGMVGLIYNSAMIDEEITSWTSMWDPKYKDQILMFNNPRDAFGVAQYILEQDVNNTDKKQWNAAKELLIQQKSLLQSYVMDEVYAKMETGEAAIAPYYAGDFLTMQDINEDLSFVYPSEGTNIFVDAVCIPKSCKNYEAALMYINFLLEPDIALANAEYIQYASPNLSVVNNEEYSFYKNEILYPSKEKMPKAQYFHDVDDDIKNYYENLWIDIKLY